MSQPDISGLRSLKNLAEGAQKKYQDKLLKVAQEVSPIKPGATVPVTGYAHRGKNMLVDSVEASLVFMGPERYRLVVTGEGQVIGTNGQPTKQRAKSVWGSTYEC